MSYGGVRGCRKKLLAREAMNISATIRVGAGPSRVMAYGTTEEEAVRKVKSIALQVLADMIESGEDVPEPLRVLFAA